MDAGMAVKPVNNVVGSHAQPGIAAPSAAPSMLPPDKAVAPVVPIAPAQNEPRQAEKDGAGTTRDAIIDPETSQVVYRTLDSRTRQVIHQQPDQAMLREQAYARAKATRALASGHNTGNSDDASHLDTLT